jgi:hypothetical protein
MKKAKKPSSPRIDILKNVRAVRDFTGAPRPTPKPDFTDEELRCIYKEVSTISWQREEFYDARRSLLKKLDIYLKVGP